MVVNMAVQMAGSSIFEYNNIDLFATYILHFCQLLYC